MVTTQQIKDALKLILKTQNDKQGQQTDIKLKKNRLFPDLDYFVCTETNVTETDIDTLLQPVITEVVSKLSALEKMAAPMFIQKNMKELKDKLKEIFEKEANKHQIPLSIFSVLIRQEEGHPVMIAFNGIEKISYIDLKNYFA